MKQYDAIIIGAGHNVGIGTNNPASQLTLYSTGASVFHMTDDGYGTTTSDGFLISYQGAVDFNLKEPDHSTIVFFRKIR